MCIQHILLSHVEITVPIGDDDDDDDNDDDGDKDHNNINNLYGANS